MTQRMRMPAAVGCFPDVVQFVHALASEANLADDLAHRLRLATDELVTNVLTHGYAAATGELELEGAVDPDRVWLRIVDTAVPFDPTQVSDPPDLDRPLSERAPGGLGLFLARTAVDDMSYQRCRGRNITTITLRREVPDLDPSEPRLPPRPG
jgi:anti-sigma regulatory factor (Ser/Thr protein kinase)